MTNIWEANCKVCGEKFGYSDFVLKRDLLRGYSRPERCPACREAHNKEVGKIAYPFFQLKPREKPFPILGLPYLGRVSSLKCKDRTPKMKPSKPHPEKMKISISEKEIQKLYQAIQNHQVIIIEGPTGCGKSTYMPYRLIEPLESFSRDFFTKNGSIIITQPRIPPTKGIPLAMGRYFLGSPTGAGYEVGYAFRGAEKKDKYGRKIRTYDRYNRADYVTDGTLLNSIEQGKLDQYSIIIVDEAHERSKNIDLILSSLKRELPKYPHLRLIISSATIDTKSFIDTFKDITDPYLLKISEEERKFKIEKHFWEGNPIPENRLPEALGEKIIDILKTTDSGGILGFLQGQAEIKRAIRAIGKSSQFKKEKSLPWGAILGYLPKKGKPSLSWIFPCYRELGEELIHKEILKKSLEPIAFKSGEVTPRRVIIATNIAETSLTIPDAVYIVDSGMIKQTEWDSDVRTTFLVPKRHSRDGCRQRWGRVGRVKDGKAYTLYTKEQFEKEFEEHTSPEITRSCLEDVILTIKASGISNLEKFPWIEPPSEEFKSELRRAERVIKERKIVDEDEDITEEGLELWQTLKSLSRVTNKASLDDASLLILADRFGCFVEALVIFAFRSLLGANLYHPNNGLFMWETGWAAKTKAAIVTIHDALRIGCEDDLEFATKLFACYLKEKDKGREIEWCKNYWINEEILNRILNDIESIIEDFSKEMKVRKEINLSSLEKLRILMIRTWPDRIVEIEHTNNPITFKIKAEPDDSAIGVISPFSAGNWKDQKNAICGATTKEMAIINGKKKSVPSSCFMVKIPKQILNYKSTSIASLLSQLQQKLIKSEKKIFFSDQEFPIGSKIEVEEKENGLYVTGRIELPQQIKPEYKEPELGEEEMESCAEDYLNPEETSRKRKQRRKETPIKFSKAYFQTQEFIQGIWAGSEKKKYAKIIGWINKNGKPTPVLSSVNKIDTINSLIKRKTDFINVTIQRVERDRIPRDDKNPYTKRGWVVVRMSTGLDIPIEMSEMTLSPLGYGLETLEGKRIRLPIKNIHKEKNLIKLSNIDNVIADLKNLYKKAKERKEGTQIEGYIKEVNEEKENTVVATPRKSGVIHSFEIYKDFVLEQNINNLQLGEKVVVELSPRDRDRISADLLDEKEIKSISQKWNYNETENIIDLPCCLEDEDLKNWSARPEVINFVKKHSWQYCFGARIINTASYREIYGALKIGSCMKGKVVEIIKNRDGKPIGINVQIEVLKGKFPIIAFMPKGKLTWKINKNSPLEVVIQEIKKFENKIISIWVLNIDSTTYPPKLFLTRKEAFKAEASIPFSGIPILIGRRGENIRNIIGNKDVNIDINRTGGKVTIKAPSQLTRDDICKEIDSQISGMGAWTKR